MSSLKHLRQTISIELQYHRKWPSDSTAQRISSLMALYSFESGRKVSMSISALPDIKSLPQWQQDYETSLPYARFLGTDVEVVWEAEIAGVNINDKKALKRFCLDMKQGLVKTHRLNTVLTPSGERVQVL